MPTSPSPAPGQSPPWLPPRWIIQLAWRIHRGLYDISGGRFGLRVPSDDDYGLMRVVTVGRRSGQPRPVMLAYLERGPDLVTMAMNGWGEPEPAWWLNLQSRPEATVQLPGGTREVVGREAEPNERDELWEMWKAVNPKLDGYATLRSKETKVVVLEPAA